MDGDVDGLAMMEYDLQDAARTDGNGGWFRVANEIIHDPHNLFEGFFGQLQSKLLVVNLLHRFRFVFQSVQLQICPIAPIPRQVE